MNFLQSSILSLASLCAVCSGQTTGPSPAPSTAPTKITFPDSFIRVTDGGRTVVCEAVDEKWVRTALANVKPATRPSTMPVDVLAKIQSTRGEITKQIAADTMLTAKDIDDAYDKLLLPAEKRASNIKVNLLVLVTTKARLTELMRGGMTLPNFRFNPQNNEIGYSPNLGLTENEQVVHSLYSPELAENTRADLLAARMREIDSMRMGAESQAGAMIVQQFYAGLLRTKVLAPLQLKDDQKWFGLGMLEWLTIKYCSPILGVDRDMMIRQVTGQPRYPIKLTSIDLLHPQDLKDMRPEYANAYLDAQGRRSLALMAAWAKRDGDAVIPKTLEAFKKAPPADGAGLVKLIKDTTGTDLSPDLKPQS